MDEEKAMKFFRNSRNAVRKWRMRALFVDLHKTRITIDAEDKERLPPWIFKRLVAAENLRRNS